MRGVGTTTKDVEDGMTRKQTTRCGDPPGGGEPKGEDTLIVFKEEKS